MHGIIEVRIRESGIIVLYDANNLEAKIGDYVIIDAERGQDYAQVICIPEAVSEEELAKKPLKKIVRIATPEDIDRAVTLGLGYPHGPLAWGDKLGAGKVLAVLEAMLAITGDPRYRPSLWLKRRALLAVSLLTPEA